jgi:hypothetical protein
LHSERPRRPCTARIEWALGLDMTAKGSAMEKQDQKDTNKVKQLSLEQLQTVSGGRRRRVGRSAN